MFEIPFIDVYEGMTAIQRRAYESFLEEDAGRFDKSIPEESLRKEGNGLFRKMGRHPLVKEILPEVKTISEDEKKSRINKWLKAVDSDRRNIEMDSNASPAYATAVFDDFAYERNLRILRNPNYFRYDR